MKSKAPLIDRLPREVTFTTSEAVRCGVSTRSLYRLVDSGQLEKVGHGLYLLPDSPVMGADLDLVETAIKSPMATICLTSALAHHDLIDEIPAAIDLALPRGKTPPALTAPVRWHSFDRRSFELDRAMITIEGSDLKLGLYSAERSIVDAYRLRAVVGYTTATESLRNWLKRTGASPARLLQIAERLPRAMGPLREALDVLL